MISFNCHGLNAYVVDINGSHGSRKDLIGAQDASLRTGMFPARIDKIRIKIVEHQSVSLLILESRNTNG